MKLDQLKKLREVREMKSDQANAALASARRSQAHWAKEERKWTNVAEKLHSHGSSVIQEVMDEYDEMDDPHLFYQKVQRVLMRHQQAKEHARHKREHAKRSLTQANETLSASVQRATQAEGRKEATGKLVDKVAADESRREEEHGDDLAIDDFAVRQGMAAKSE